MTSFNENDPPVNKNSKYNASNKKLKYEKGVTFLVHPVCTYEAGL